MNLKDLIKKGVDLTLDDEVRVVNINDPRSEEEILAANEAHPIVQLDEDAEGNVYLYYAGPVPEEIIE